LFDKKTKNIFLKFNTRKCVIYKRASFLTTVWCHCEHYSSQNTGCCRRYIADIGILGFRLHWKSR